ncbi:EmrB/QacA subfamily drug resistance transporter [Paenibacillus phyllosphaerae]|uniref:EmrB/QacA subfamily drug resistance transporter n=1 Tax=Paenibacillus phyllosphaerae TaxID=274593 RepID=A0A7W5AWL1_9BACL|nr:MFS transporter [Paenibacillus phyllosphaerae]MBB3110135.1 EmrB/QacA subfamily drug resistance transporter [Paenibacillus phyllosphaerae]
MHQSKWILLTIIIACQLIVVLDASIMVTAVPEIGRTLHMSTTSLTWVHNSYILAFGGFLLLGARAGDLWGRKRILSAGIGLFSLTSLLAGLAPTAEFLLVSRACQGLAAAMATPAALALLSANFVEAKERTRAIAMYSAVSAAGGSIGLILGGFFTDFITWRAGMFINVPIGMVLLYLVQRHIERTDTRTGRFDLMGAITSVTGMTSLVYGLVQAADSGWANPASWIPLASGLLLLGLFVLIEARAAEPIVPLRLFKSRQRSGAYLGRFLIVCGNFSLFFFVPQYLQNVLGYSSFEAGLAFLPFTGAQFGMMYLIQGLVHRFGMIKVMTAGLLLASLGTLWLSKIILAQEAFFPHMFILLSIMGVGSGMVFQPLTALGLADVEARDAGAASGLINVAHQSGSSFGLAALVTVFDAGVGSDQPSTLQLAHALSNSVLGSVAFILAALTVTLLCSLPSRQPARKQALTDS